MTAGKVRGYRVRTTVFVPADPKDMNATRDAINFADTYSKLAPTAPKGCVIEKFSATPGMLEDSE